MNNTGCFSIVALIFTAYFSVPVLFGPNVTVEINPNDKIVVKDCSLMKINTKKLKFDGAVKKIEEDQSVMFCGDSATVNDVQYYKVTHASDTGFLASDEFKQHSTTKYSEFWSQLNFQKDKITFWLLGILIALVAIFVKIRSIHKSFLSEHQ
jgi:hypothetical protein